MLSDSYVNNWKAKNHIHDPPLFCSCGIELIGHQNQWAFCLHDERKESPLCQLPMHYTIHTLQTIGLPIKDGQRRNWENALHLDIRNRLSLHDGTSHIYNALRFIRTSNASKISFIVKLHWQWCLTSIFYDAFMHYSVLLANKAEVLS